MNATTLRPLAAAIALLSYLAAVPAHATDFAILLSPDDDRSRQPQTINNPVHEENSNNGENPLYEPSAIVIWPDQFLGDRELLLEVSFRESIDGELPPIPGNGYAFEINLFDFETNEPITQFDSPIDIGLVIPQLSHLHGEGVVHRDLALRFLDESRDPPEWRAQGDPILTCKTDKNTFCGKTDHLTIFAFGAVPEPSSLALLLIATPLCCRRRR